ncbi:MAG: hypothetical protein KY458_07535 [Actinobacteria bacterium]|nr:hypothetical protein [Actinomycetota bacterium]
MHVDDSAADPDWFYFSLAPPEVYVRLETEVYLDDDELGAAAARLVDERAAVDPLVARRRREWVNHVATFWKDARQRRATMAFTMVYDAEGLPAKSFVMAFEGEREHDDIEAEIASLEAALSVKREGDATQPEVSVVQLPAGPAVRVRKLMETEPEKRRSRVIDMVLYWVPVPERPVCLLLSFTTPVLVLADILAEIADDIAQSLRFTRDQ